MEQKINIAELLKDCPKGYSITKEVYNTRLYSPLYPMANDEEHGIENDENYNCSLIDIVEEYGYTYVVVRADCRDVNGDFETFHDGGELCLGGECMLFPSKENRDWNTFKAPWKEQPKFKVGDVVNIPTKEKNNLFCVESVESGSDYHIPLHGIYDFPDITHKLATPEEIAKWNEEVLQPNHMHYSTSKRKIIHWFKEFDRVVVREIHDKCSYWFPDFFAYYDKKAKGYCVIGDECVCFICLPYNEKTAKLIGTTNDYKEE